MINFAKNILPVFFKNRVIEMTLFVTDKCNFKCKHCFMITQLNTLSERELSLEEYKKIGGDISSLQRVHIGGGEPLIRKDISEIVLTVANEWDTEVICLPTNGSFTSNSVKVVSDFKSHSKKYLRFHLSLSVMGEDLSKFAKFPNAFEKWLETVNEVKKVTSTCENISLTVLSTFNDYNQGEIENFINFVEKEVQPDDFSFALVRTHDKYKPDLEIGRFKEFNHKVHSESKSHNPIIRAYRQVIREMISNYYMNPAYKVPCQSGKMRIVVSPNGNVYPCETLGYPEGEDYSEWCMGNVREYDYSIKKLLKNKAARKVRSRIRKNRCHCHHGVDMSVSFQCSWRFRFRVLLRSIQYLIKK